jgi:hypothetical protein
MRLWEASMERSSEFAARGASERIWCPRISIDVREVKGTSESMVEMIPGTWVG